VLHLQRGTPYIYQGEEIGMTNVRFDSIADYRDIESLNHYREAVEEFDRSPASVLAGVHAMGRDNARTPMQWDASPNAGFSTGTPWLAVNPNHTEINVAADRSGERSVFRFYQALIRLRHENRVVALGDFELLEPDHGQLYAFTRSLDGETLLVVANAADAPLAPPLPPSVAALLTTAERILGNYPEQEAPAAASPLRPWEATLYRLP